MEGLGQVLLSCLELFQIGVIPGRLHVLPLADLPLAHRGRCGSLPDREME